MNHIDPGNSRRPDKGPQRPVRSQNTARGRKKAKKKANNMLPVIVLGVGGVVVIALIIMGLKTLFSGNEGGAGAGATESSSILNAEASTAPTPVPSPTPTPPPAPAKEADITGKEVIQYGDMVIVGDGAYDYYKFNEEKAGRFMAAVNKSAAGLSADTSIYSMIIPGAVDVMLPLSFLDEHADKTSDQEKAIRYLNKGLNGMNHIELYPLLKAHCDEKLYFKSDNHWTSLAAYYAYSGWAYAKGLTASPLTEYEKVSFGGFLGNQYGFTESTAISATEDVEIYKPKANLVISEAGGEGETAVEIPWILDVSEYPTNEKYKAFLGGSRGLTKLVNKDITDGSACILVGDSNGTPIAPYIAQHYGTTYFVDYRNYESTLSALQQETNAKDVIYCISIVASAADSLIEGLNGL